MEGKGGHRDVACGDCVALFDILVIQLFEVLIHPPERNSESMLSEHCSAQNLRESLVMGRLLGVTLVPLVLPTFVLSLGATVLHRNRS